VGRPLVNVLATVAQFEIDLIRLRTREAIAVAGPRAACAASGRR